jgi:hypothetical protein
VLMSVLGNVQTLPQRRFLSRGFSWTPRKTLAFDGVV